MTYQLLNTIADSSNIIRVLPEQKIFNVFKKKRKAILSSALLEKPA